MNQTFLFFEQQARDAERAALARRSEAKAAALKATIYPTHFKKP